MSMQSRTEIQDKIDSLRGEIKTMIAENSTLRQRVKEANEFTNIVSAYFMEKWAKRKDPGLQESLELKILAMLNLKK